MTASPAGPLFAAGHVQSMAANTHDKKLAFALTGLSVALVGIMVYRELTSCFRDRNELSHVQCLHRDRLEDRMERHHSEGRHR